MSEVCPKCGSSSFMGDVNMTPRRFCKCGETWLPKPKEESKTVFDLNDRVTAFGVDGVVISVEDGDYYPIKVRFSNTSYASFCRSGKLELWHLEPSLRLIEKAKKKVKKKFWFYVPEIEIKKESFNVKVYSYPIIEAPLLHRIEIELEVEG